MRCHIPVSPFDYRLEHWIAMWCQGGTDHGSTGQQLLQNGRSEQLEPATLSPLHDQPRFEDSRRPLRAAPMHFFWRHGSLPKQCTFMTPPFYEPLGPLGGDHGGHEMGGASLRCLFGGNRFRGQHSVGEIQGFFFCAGLSRKPRVISFCAENLCTISPNCKGKCTISWGRMRPCKNCTLQNDSDMLPLIRQMTPCAFEGEWFA